MKIILAIAALLTATPALADDLTEGDTCRIGSTYEPAPEGAARTMMLISQDQKGFDQDDIYVAFFNDNWSIAKGDSIGQVKVTNTTDGSWLASEAVAMDHGFLVVTSYKYFRDVFSSAGGIHVTRKNGTTIDRLSLSFMDFLAFDQCRDKKVAVKAELDRKAKLKNSIPADPFKK